METTTCIKPKTLAELLPGLSGILSKDSIQTLTAKKQPPPRIVVSGTAEKVVKPLTAAEMRADILSLRVQSPRIFAQGNSTKRKTWNSTVKIEKTVSRTANGQLKNNPVKKALNFQPRPNPVSNSRTTVQSSNGAPKFLKPDLGAKKKLFSQARNNIRISGISNISETPIINKNFKSRMTIANKENIPKRNNVKTAPPKVFYQRKYIPPVPDTPLSNESWKSGSDSSFLQNEKEINDVEEKAKTLTEERTLENIAEVTPPVSTPFREYRNVKEFFDQTNDIDNSAACHDNTIMCFDNPSDSQENKREESVIVSLCDLLNKATVTNTEVSTELKDLLLIEKRTEHNIEMIENSIAALNKIKESQLASLQSVKRLIQEKQGADDANKTLTPMAKESKIKVENETTHFNTKSYSKVSVIQTVAKSPTYKIPKRNLCLRKKVFCKSMPDISNNNDKTPVKTDMGHQAFSMYMKMKEHMNFLSTPIAINSLGVPNTPALTSHNLQKQLDKLYSEN